MSDKSHNKRRRFDTDHQCSEMPKGVWIRLGGEEHTLILTDENYTGPVWRYKEKTYPLPQEEKPYHKNYNGTVYQCGWCLEKIQ